MDQAKTCALAGKDGPCGAVHRRGWCRKHYTRYQRHGDPHVTLKRGKGQLLAELHAAAEATSDECVILTVRGEHRPTARIDGVTMLASRAVWVLTHGDPGDAHVLHTCHRGKEGCINLRHLYLGDNTQNIRDMVGAGRSTRGELDGNAKLSAPEVQEIRGLLREGVPYEVIAGRYRVSGSTVYQINAGKIWGWLPEASA